MSAYFFGLGNGRVSQRERQRIQKAIADAGLDADFVAVDSIGLGTRYWFQAPNRGEPFDSQTAKRVLAAVGTVKVKR